MLFVDDLLGAVFHIGHLNCSAGYIGDENAIFTTRAALCTSASDEAVLAEEARGRDRPSPLLVDQHVASPGAYCSFIDRVLRRLNCQPAELPLMLTSQDCSAGYGADRRAVAALLFEELRVPALYFVSKLLAALFSAGRISGVVVDVGAHHVDCAAAHDGYLLRQTLRSVAWGGETVTAALRCDVERQFAGGHVPGTFIEVSPAGSSALSLARPATTLRAFALEDQYRQLKEDVFAFGVTDEHVLTLKLPDGQRLRAFQTEQSSWWLFAPKDGNLGGRVNALIEECHIDSRKTIAVNIVLTGGGSLTPNLQRDLEHALFNTAPSYLKPKVAASPKALERKSASWLGASILASVGDFQRFWVSKFDYQESGEFVLLRKCIN